MVPPNTMGGGRVCDTWVDVIELYHSLSRNDVLEAWQTSTPQNGRSLFEVELYLLASLCVNPLSQLH
jgi:hypothetical protein